MDFNNITPELIVTCLNILIIVFLFLGFLIGFIRGTFKATFRFVASIVIILGCWSLFPLITSKLMDFDISKITTLNVYGHDVTSLREALEFATEAALGFIKEENGTWTQYTGSVVISETMLYGLLYGLCEMVMRVLLVIIVLILNFTLLRLIVGIIYLIIKPKRRDETGHKIKKKWSTRLIGGLIGTVNMIALMLIVCVPLSGVFSIADNVVGTVTEDESSEVVKLSLGKEVLDLSNMGFEASDLDTAKKWTSVYRKTITGTIFSVKIKGTAIDNRMFDKVFSFKVNGESIAIRAEINTCTNALSVIKEEIIIPVIKSQEFTPELLDSLTGEDISKVFTELGNLKLINAVVPIGIESAIFYVQNNAENNTQYADIVYLFKTINPSEIIISDTLVQIGNLAGSLYDLFLDTGYKPSDIVNSQDTLMADIVDKLLVLNPDKVDKVINALADLEVIDKLNDLAFTTAEDYLQENESIKQYTILLPLITISDDGYYVIKGVKTSILKTKEISELVITVDSENHWVIDGVATDIDASENIFDISLKDIKITDEIRNISNLYRAFSKLGISSISEINALINNSETEDKLNLDAFTYDNIHDLFQSILDFKIVSSVKDNVYVIVNNFGLPVTFRDTIVRTDISADDLTYLVLAAKTVIDTGVLWDKSVIYSDDKLDYQKLGTLFDENKETIIDNIMKSNLITDNIPVVANVALNMFLPDLQLDLDGINWKTEGKDELMHLFDAASSVIKHLDEIQSDIWGLSDEAIDEICQALIDNLSQSKLLQSNMNNFIDMVMKTDYLKDLGIVITHLDDEDWNAEELKNIFASVKVAAKMLNKDENGEKKDILIEALKLTNDEIDVLLKSKFLVTNLVSNLCEMTKPGGRLDKVIIVNYEPTADIWYDVLDENGAIITKGEIRKILENAIKLINGIESFEDINAIISQAIKNLSTLTNNIGSTNPEDDEIGEVLSSEIVTDTIIYHLVNLSDNLPESIQGLVVVDKENITWKDNGNTPGELRNIISSAIDLLIDSEGNVLYEKLVSGDIKEIAKIVFNTPNEKITKVLNSKIVLDTMIKFVNDYSKPTPEREYIIYLKEKNRTDAIWRDELTKIIIGAKKVAFKEDGELISLDGGVEEYIKILTDIDDDEVTDIIASEILVDTIANFIIDMADEEDALFKVNASYRTYDTELWRSELKRIIKAARVLLVNDDGSLAYNDLMNGTTEKRLEILINIDDTDTLVASDILVDTISNLIIDMSKEENSIIYLKEDVEAYNTESWREEIKKIVSSAKDLLVKVDGEGNKTLLTDKLTSNNLEDMMDLIIELDSTKIENVLDSKVILDTIQHILIDFSNEEDSIITVSEYLKVTKFDDRVIWKQEITDMFNSAKALLVYTDEEGKEINQTDKLLSNDLTKLLELITNLEDTEINDVVKSIIIVDTISNLLIDMSKEEDSVIIITSEIEGYSTDLWREEIKRIITSSKLLLLDEEGNSQAEKLVSGTQDEILLLIINLGTDDNKITSVISSDVIYETLKKQVKDLGNSSEGEAMIKIPSNIDSWTRSDWKDEIKAIITAADCLIVEIDEYGKKKVVLDNINGSQDKLLLTVSNLTNDNINDIMNSKIIYETLTVQVKDLATDGSFISMPEDIDSWNKEIWTSEMIAIVDALNILFSEDDLAGNKRININKLDDSDENKLLQTIADLTEDEVVGGKTIPGELTLILNSRIIVKTISKQILEFGKDTTDEYGNVTKEAIIVCDGVEDYTDEEWSLEIKRVIKAVKLLLTNEEGQIDVNMLNGDTDAILNLITKLSTEETTEHKDEVKIIMESQIIYDTMVKTIKDLSNGEDSLIKLPTNINDYTKLMWEDELKNIIKSVKILLTDEEGQIDSTALNSGETNDLLQLITDVDSNEMDIVLSSNIIYTTIISQIIEFGKPGGDITLDTVKYNLDTDKAIWTSEIKKMVESIKLILKDETGKVNIEITKDVNKLVTNVVSLNSDPNGTNDELGNVVSSDIISDTIIAKIKEQDKVNGGSLAIPNDVIWKDTRDASSYITATGELRHMFEAVSVLFGDDEIDIENIDTNDLLNRIKNLRNAPNEDNDEVGTLLGSKVLGETVIVNIKNEDKMNGGVLNVDETSIVWYDVYTGDVITTTGELRRILKALPIVFGEDEIDISKVDANSILKLTDSEVDSVLESRILHDTIEDKVMELDGKNDIVVNPITDLSVEVKALIKAANIILADSEGNVDLNNPDFEVEKILTISGTDQDKILESQIIVDTIKAQLILLGDDDTDILLVDADHITDWKKEIKCIINNSTFVLKADANGKYLTNPTVDYESIYSLDEGRITSLIESKIISDTIAIALMEQDSIYNDKLLSEISYDVTGFGEMTRREKNIIIANDSIWSDVYTAGVLTYTGEVHRVLSAASKLIDGEDFNINKVKDLTNDDLQTVFNSRLLLDTFYNEIDKLSVGTDPVLFVRTETVRSKEEAVKFVKAIQVILGPDLDLTTLDSTAFNFDDFITRTDTEIDTIVDSEILRFSAAKKVYPILSTGGSLEDYVLLAGDTENEKLLTIEDDLGNLIKVIRDLKSDEIGIDYQEFSFNKFLEIIDNAPDPTAKADEISDIMVKSNILTASLSKMTQTILEGTLSDDMMACVDLNMDTPSAPNGKTYWLDYDANANMTIEDSEIGEFKKIMRMLTYIDMFTNNNNSNVTDKDTIANPLKSLNHSRVLHGVIPKFVDTSLDNVRDWKYEATDPLYRETLTVEEWDNEIDVICGVIASVNSENGIANLGSLDVKNNDLQIASLGNILKQIARSRLLDIANIEGFIESAVSSTITPVTVCSVYTGSVYDEKVLAWNGTSDIDGEIDSLMDAVEQLRFITSINIVDTTPVSGSDAYQGVVNARILGRFLNECKESIMLKDVIKTIYKNLTTIDLSDNEIETTNFETTLVAYSQTAIQYSLLFG